MPQWNLLNMPFVGKFIRSRWYPGIFQYPLLFLLLIILLWAFFGTIQASTNISTLMMWGLWWTLLPYSFLLLGRIWCGVCPLAKMGDLAQRLFKRSRRYPGPFLRRNGIWIMIALFLLLTWFDRVTSFANSPKATGILLLILLAGAVLIMIFFKRRAWCRYLCPIGGLSGIYSMASFTELRTRKKTCQKACMKKECVAGKGEVLGCPLFERPPVMESNRNCNFCANCLKNCSHDALSWHIRSPLKELSRFRQRIPAEAFLALIMVILVFVQTIGMSKIFPVYMKWLIERTFLQNYHVAFTMTFAGLLLFGLGIYGLVSYLSSRYSEESLIRNFASFGYALIPLGLAGLLAHNLLHLLTESKNAVRIILLTSGVLSGDIKAAAFSSHAMMKVSPFIKAGQISMVLLGFLGSAVVLVRFNRLLGENPHFNWHRILPHLILTITFAVLFILLFLLPMNPMHFH